MTPPMQESSVAGQTGSVDAELIAVIVSVTRANRAC